jgi:hypothetical protein
MSHHVALINGWSATEVLGLALLMLATLLGVMNRGSVSIALAQYTYRPRMLPREEDPERIRETRQHHRWLARIYRVALVFVAIFIWVGAIAALIDGRDGPVFDALL